MNPRPYPRLRRGQPRYKTNRVELSDGDKC